MKYLKCFWPVYALTVCLFLALVVGANRSITAIAENEPIPRKPVFIIDAGHGGVDGGATSYSGVLESQINLEIALRLDDLMHLMGFETRMIRTTDISVYTEGNTIGAKKISDLKNRVKTVNETENAFLISIHQNTFPQGKYRGAQVFYNDKSKIMAEKLQKAFIQTINPGSTRSCKSSEGIYLMEHIDRPGLLIECGFISNPEEDANLRSGEYQKKICCVITATLNHMLSNT